MGGIVVLLVSFILLTGTLGLIAGVARWFAG